MQEIYQKVAQLFASRIDTIFESEISLEQEFKRNYEGLPFSRTNHWDGILYFLLREAWLEAGPEVKSEPTNFDKLSILRALHSLLDYNLFSQVLLNLQSYVGMAYQTGDAEKEIARLKESWPKDAKLDPFAPKVHMVKQAEIVTEEQKQYNLMLSTLRALRIITQFTPQISSRVSCKGSTPALADSRNMSMIGEGGDVYLKTLSNLGVFYLQWDRVPQMAQFQSQVPPDPRGMRLHAGGIPYDFYSKSGGEILQGVLFVRKLLYSIFIAVNVIQETCIMVPRLNSILLIGDQYGVSIKRAVENLKVEYPMIRLLEGARQ